MKIRITSDGTPFGTQLRDADTGELIEGVFDVQVSLPAGDVVRATIKTFLTQFDVVAEAERIVCCPACRKEMSTRDDPQAVL